MNATLPPGEQHIYYQQENLAQCFSKINLNFLVLQLICLIQNTKITLLAIRLYFWMINQLDAPLHLTQACTA